MSKLKSIKINDTGQRSIIILPDDTASSITAAINNAKISIRVKMFRFSDPGLIAAIIASKARGVKVKVMLNPTRRDGGEENELTRLTLEKAGIEVKSSNPDFNLTHEKSMVIDDTIAFIKSLNWETKNLTDTRDYAIITSHPFEVAEVIMCFEADWQRKDFNPGKDAYLIWCKGNGREKMARFIDEAKHTLVIQNEKFQDLVILERLVKAACRGVKIQVMVRSPRTLKKAKLIEGVGGLRIMNHVGIEIHQLTNLKLHGKILLADDCRAIIGSINISSGSFDNRRELAIEVNDAAIMLRLQQTAKFDWENSQKLDLSDEGLFKDLELRSNGGAQKPVLHLDEKKKKTM